MGLGQEGSVVIGAAEVRPMMAIAIADWMNCMLVDTVKTKYLKRVEVVKWS